MNRRAVLSFSRSSVFGMRSFGTPAAFSSKLMNVLDSRMCRNIDFCGQNCKQCQHSNRQQEHMVYQRCWHCIRREGVAIGSDSFLYSKRHREEFFVHSKRRELRLHTQAICLKPAAENFLLLEKFHTVTCLQRPYT